LFDDVLEKHRSLDRRRPKDNASHTQFVELLDIVQRPYTASTLDGNVDVIEDSFERSQVVSIIGIECSVEIDYVQHLDTGVVPLASHVKWVLGIDSLFGGASLR
jgi:hypothetical protein